MGKEFKRQILARTTFIMILIGILAVCAIGYWYAIKGGGV